MKIMKDDVVRKASFIAFALIALAAVFTVLGNIGGSIDRNMRTLRYAIGDKDPSGTIALIAMDERSIQDIGVYPWPRGTHGRLIEALQDKGVKRLGFDISFVSDAPEEADDEAFANAITQSEFPVGLAVPGDDTGGHTTGKGTGNVVKGVWPNKRLTDAGADTFSIWTDLNGDGQFEYAPQENIVDGSSMVPIAKWLVNKPASEGRYLVDWNLDQRDIPVYSYSDILNGKVPAEELQGKSLLVGADASRLGDFLPISTGEYVAGARAQIIAAETIRFGNIPSIHPGWPALVALLIAGMVITLLNGGYRYAALGAAAAILATAQSMLEAQNIAILPVGDALLTIAYSLLAVTTLDILRYFYGRMTKNEATGLPNMMALKKSPNQKTGMIVMHVSNNLDILSELGAEGRDKIMVKVAQRIEMAIPGRRVYQIDSSSFTWRANSTSDEDIAQIESIQNTLRSGISFATATIDIFTNAGIELSKNLSVEKAVENAGIAANRANARGISWEIYKEGDTDEMWKISVVSEINSAIKQGHLWVAYQPKVDGKTDKIIGAEALVRWKHPTRGDVRPDAFIPLLEKANRTEDLTRFMIDQATKDFATLGCCSVAVNVSPLMIGQGKLLAMVKDALAKNSYEPSRLTIEVTESEKFNDPTAIAELQKVRDLGVKISIDDYGMGNSTVNYLRILPANELKIDRSFIANMLTNNSDRVVVASTIQLAHEMDLKVVAEGVESAEIQSYLSKLGCDIIQGYHTGKPIPFSLFSEAAQHSCGGSCQ